MDASGDRRDGDCRFVDVALKSGKDSDDCGDMSHNRDNATFSPAAIPIHLAQIIVPSLADLTWAIGGSTLLCHLGLIDDPRDLDIVVPPKDFDAVLQRLSERLGPHTRPASPDLISDGFARFLPPGLPSVDVMAGIAVRGPNGVQRWHFDASRIDIHDGLPWMKPDDWLVLYQLFNRPGRVALLERYLSARAVRP